MAYTSCLHVFTDECNIEKEEKETEMTKPLTTTHA